MDKIIRWTKEYRGQTVCYIDRQAMARRAHIGRQVNILMIGHLLASSSTFLTFLTTPQSISIHILMYHINAIVYVGMHLDTFTLLLIQS